MGFAFLHHPPLGIEDDAHTQNMSWNEIGFSSFTFCSRDGFASDLNHALKYGEIVERKTFIKITMKST